MSSRPFTVSACASVSPIASSIRWGWIINLSDSLQVEKLIIPLYVRVYAMAPERKELEKVNTDVSHEALITLFRDIADDALHDHSHRDPADACEAIRDVCDNILEDNEK